MEQTLRPVSGSFNQPQLPIAELPICLQIKDLSLYYGDKQALNAVTMPGAEEQSNGFYRSFRLRQVDPAALL